MTSLTIRYPFFCMTFLIFKCSGITNEADEARDAPNYVPRVFSTSTHYGSIYTDSRFTVIQSHIHFHWIPLWMGCGIQCMWIPLRIHIHWSQVHSHPDRQASGPLALKRRSRTPLYASSLPGRRHQVEIINEFRLSVKIINTRNQRPLCQQYICNDGHWRKAESTHIILLVYEWDKIMIAGKRRRSPIVIVPHRNVLEKVASHQRFINASLQDDDDDLSLFETSVWLPCSYTKRLE